MAERTKKTGSTRPAESKPVSLSGEPWPGTPLYCITQTPDGVRLTWANPDFLGMVTQVLLAVIVIWFLARFAVVLPAAAIGVPLSLGKAYGATRGLASRIMGINIVTILMMTTFGLGFDALASIAASFFSGVTPWTTIVAETAPKAFFNLLSVGVSITLLSAIFKQIWAAAPSGDPD